MMSGAGPHETDTWELWIEMCMYHQCMSELDEKIFGMLDLGELG